MHGKGDSVKIFTFLKGHGINLLIALVLLFAQANCELTLPGLMSDIVDVGISRGGIESVVPEKILADDLAQVELFLDAKTAQALDEAYTAADAAGTGMFSPTQYSPCNSCTSIGMGSIAYLAKTGKSTISD